MSEFKSITLICEDTPDGIFSAVYDAWVLMLEGNKVNIYPGDDYSYDLFSEYRECETNTKKAESVVESIRKNISVEAYTIVFRACMHYDKGRGNKILDFLKVGYRAGARVTKMYADYRVMDLIELDRKCGNEAHLFKGFIRFSEINGGILFSKIAPKCDVLILVEQHFSNRYPEENWIIYDENRKKALVHKYKSDAIILQGEQVEEMVDNIEVNDEYDKLWNVFFNTIGIESRKNPRCQRTMIPIWYRKNMPEFK